MKGMKKMSDREKLIELLREGIRADNEKKEAWILGGKVGEKPSVFENMADHLIAHGVTVQEWISVKDRLPEDEVQVLACTKHGKPFPAHCKYGKWRVPDSVTITHWMPLPQPPKGE